eukprot:470951_1
MSFVNWQLCIMLSIFHVSESYDAWVYGGSLPSMNIHGGSGNMAIGYNPNEQYIWMLGGQYQETSLLSFNVVTKTFNHYPNYLPTPVSAWSQIYTQIGNILWMVDYQNQISSFNTFDLDTKQFVSGYNSISFPQTVDISSCLASIIGQNQYLAVVGGRNGNALNLLQIFNISSNTWLDESNIPSMNLERTTSSCIVSNNHLYAIGGWNLIEPYYLSSVESLDISEIIQDSVITKQWQFTQGSLSETKENTRTLEHGTDLMVLGGGRYIKTVDIIDTVTNTITSAGPLLYTAVYSTSAIIVDNTAYAFGGTSAGGHINHWQYSVLPTLSPTASPSIFPSINPSQTPSKYPTIAPSIVSSETPTKATNNPTNVPTKYPTIEPTPSINPSQTPSKYPTIAPTPFPTHTGFTFEYIGCYND